MALHLLQNCMVYVNTLMVQRVLGEPIWLKHMGVTEQRALTPLFWGHVNPYGTFRLDMTAPACPSICPPRTPVRINPWSRASDGPHSTATLRPVTGMLGLGRLCAWSATTGVTAPLRKRRAPDTPC